MLPPAPAPEPLSFREPTCIRRRAMFPLARVEIDFDGNPGDLPPTYRGGQWTDVTQWVRAVSSRRGVPTRLPAAMRRER